MLLGDPSTAPLDPNVSRDVTLQFTPRTRGTKTAFLELTTNDPDVPKARIPLTARAIESPSLWMIYGR